MSGIKNRLKETFGGTNIKILSIFAVVAFGLFAFFKFATEVVEGETLTADVWLLQVLRTPGHLEEPVGPAWLLNATIDITALGGVTIISLVTAVASISMILLRKYFLSCYFFVSFVFAAIANYFLKHYYARSRPNAVPHLVSVATDSFPSGHSLMSAVVYLTIGTLLSAIFDDRKVKIFIILVAALLPIAIGFSRVYLGVHYPSDVAAGWLFGLIWAIASGIIARLCSALTRSAN